MNCSNPVDPAVLAEYWLNSLPQPEEETIEEHLLACDDCGAQLREVIALAEGVRELARQGSLRMVVSETFLDLAAKGGLKVREYSVAPGGRVDCTVTADDNLLIADLALNLSGVRQIDLCLCDARGVEQLRLPDIPVQSAASRVIYQESITFAQALPTTRLIVRLLAVDEQGGDRLVGEYTFDHTRTLDGPGVPPLI